MGGLVDHDKIARVHRSEIIGPVDFMERALAGAMRLSGSRGSIQTVQPIVLKVDGRESPG
jgi:hypothetical protein